MEKEFDHLYECVSNHSWQELKKSLSHMQNIDIASFIEGLSFEQALIVFRTLDKDVAAEIFANLANEQQEDLIGAITDEEIQHLMRGLMIDDAVDMLGELPANLVNRILRHTSPQTRTLINQYLLYPEFSAGSIMTAEFVQLKKEFSVKEAINHIRHVGEDRET
ncbi:MAG: magnesium transporter, partial [Sphaerochaetaceae bacterium]